MLGVLGKQVTKCRPSSCRWEDRFNCASARNSLHQLGAHREIRSPLSGGPLGSTGAISLFYPHGYSTCFWNSVSDPLKGQFQVKTLLPLEIYSDKIYFPKQTGLQTFLSLVSAHRSPRVWTPPGLGLGSGSLPLTSSSPFSALAASASAASKLLFKFTSLLTAHHEEQMLEHLTWKRKKGGVYWVIFNSAFKDFHQLRVFFFFFKFISLVLQHTPKWWMGLVFLHLPCSASLICLCCGPHIWQTS